VCCCDSLKGKLPLSRPTPRPLFHWLDAHGCPDSAEPVPTVSLQAVVEKVGVRPEEIGDIVVVLAPHHKAQRANECRMAAFFAGFPGETCQRRVSTVTAPLNCLKSKVIGALHVCL